MTEFFTAQRPVSDTVPPIITIDSPSNMSNVLSPVTVTGTAFDNIAIRTVELRTDGSPFAKIATGTTSWTVSLTLATGNHMIDARVTDFSGNQNTSEISVTVTGQSAGGPGIDLVAIASVIAVAMIVAGVSVAPIVPRRQKTEASHQPRG